MAFIRSVEAAARLGHGDQHIRELAKAGKLPAFKRGRFWYFREEDVAAYKDGAGAVPYQPKPRK